MTSYNIKGAPFPYSANPAKQLRRRQEPELPESLDEDLRALITRLNGFVYMGDRTNAIVDTIRALRADHELAARLLGFESRQEWAYRYKGPEPGKFFTEIIPMRNQSDAEVTRDQFQKAYPMAQAQALCRTVWTSEWEVLDGQDL